MAIRSSAGGRPSKRCQAFTTKGKQCRRVAVDGEEFCSVHLHIPPKPSGIWKEVVAAGALVGNIQTVYKGLEIIVHIIEKIVHHWPPGLMLAGIQSQPNDFERLAELVDGPRNIKTWIGGSAGFDSLPPNWLRARLLYTAASQLLQGRPGGREDTWLFDEFDEWFRTVEADIPGLDAMMMDKAEIAFSDMPIEVEALFEGELAVGPPVAPFVGATASEEGMILEVGAAREEDDDDEFHVTAE